VEAAAEVGEGEAVGGLDGLGDLAVEAGEDLVRESSAATGPPLRAWTRR